MKNIFKTGLLVLCGACFLVACDDDNDSNPVLQSPKTFTLNTPAYSQANIDLATSDSLQFTWSQPDYGGFPAACEYQLQVSPNGSFTKEFNDSTEDNTVNEGADYFTLSSYYTSCKGAVPASELATALQKLCNWEEGQTFDEKTLTVRATSYIAGNNTTTKTPTIYSNTVTVNVTPYYVELKNADPEIWYLIGGCIGDGSWGTDIGTQVIPLMPIEGETYDAKTGRGKISWTGYLTSAGFKLRKSLANWDVQIGQGDEYGQFKVNDGGSGNITVPEDGIYTVTLDTKQYAADETAGNATTSALTIVAYEGTPSVYTAMAMPGNENGWDAAGGNVMSASNTATGNVDNNHDWYATVTYAADAPSDGGVKFAANGGWDFNWGAAAFPYGTGVNGGANIMFKAGTYKVVFNDITGQYYFIAQ